jgi:hypothetical protein
MVVVPQYVSTALHSAFSLSLSLTVHGSSQLPSAVDRSVAAANDTRTSPARLNASGVATQTV